MLRDPLEEQLDLPALLVADADGQCWQGHLVRQEHQRLASFRVVVAHAPNLRQVVLTGIEAIQQDALVADQAGRADAPLSGSGPRHHGRALDSCARRHPRSGLSSSFPYEELHGFAIALIPAVLRMKSVTCCIGFLSLSTSFTTYPAVTSYSSCGSAAVSSHRPRCPDSLGDTGKGAPQIMQSEASPRISSHLGQLHLGLHQVASLASTGEHVFSITPPPRAA